MIKKFVFESFQAYLDFASENFTPLNEDKNFDITLEEVKNLVKKILEKQKKFLLQKSKFKDYMGSENPYDEWLKDWKKGNEGKSFPTENQKSYGAFAAVYLWDKLSEGQKNDVYTSILIDLEDRGFDRISEIERIVEKGDNLLSRPHILIFPTEIVEEIVTKKEEEGVSLSLLRGEDEKKLFKDNEWKLEDDSFQTPELKEKITSEIESVVRDFSSGKLKIESIKIESSCSRYRNTGPAEGLSWGELSYQRSLSISKIFGLVADKYNLSAEKREELRSLIKLDYKGTNGDGTSGPNPLEPARYGYYDKNSKFIENNGSFDKSRTTVVVSNLAPEGKPSDTLKTGEIPLDNSKEDYNQYKYVNVKITGSKSVITDPSGDTIVEVKIKTEYTPVYALPLKEGIKPRTNVGPKNPPRKRGKIIGIPGIGTNPDACPEL